MSLHEAIGIDVGGTHMRAARVTADGLLHDAVRRRTPTESADAVIDAIVALVDGFDPALAVGIGVAGIVHADGRVVYGPNLVLRDVPLGGIIAAQREGTVVVANDATFAAVGEHRVGAGRGVDDLVMVTIGTGVGGGVVAHGRPVLGANGFAGELGHLPVPQGTRVCGCGATGCLEAHASGAALRAIMHERWAAGEATSVAPVDRTTVTLDAITDAAGDGDPLAIAVIADAARALGSALASVTTAVDPEVIVIGGGAGQLLAPWLVPAVRDSLAREVFGAAFRRLPEVRSAQLGDDSGTVGAALTAMDSLRAAESRE
jgi:glucokinase